jgi:hypothetical protein
MSIPSNLYAEKVFGEHPIALWSLDEVVDYTALISPSKRDFTNSSVWNFSGGNIVKDFSFPRPLEDVDCFHLTSPNTLTYSLNAVDLVDSYLSPRLRTVSVGFYAYVETVNVEHFDIKFFYDNLGQPHYTNDSVVSKRFIPKSLDGWHYYSATFEIPEDEVVELEAISSVVDTPVVCQLENHGLMDNDRILLSSSDRLPGNVSENTIYYVKYVDDDTFQISLTPDGPSVLPTAPSSGKITFTLVKTFDVGLDLTIAEPSPSSIFIHGFSIGQDSEEFQEKSMGQIPQPFNKIDLGTFGRVLPANSYGLQKSEAYYVVRNNEMLAKNTNMPMVFGSETLTSLQDDPRGGPSMIFPGLGFLNEAGRFRTYTVEFWLRLNSNTPAPFRIFGPVASSDGLYVDGPFFILKIGDSVRSHYAGDTYRPMLLNLIVFPGGAALVINGEKVLELTFEENLPLPAIFSPAGREQDWLGFYSSKDIISFDIDCFAIYPYRVSTSLSKRRYVYGQAVDFPEGLASLYNGKAFLVDFPVSRYGKVYSYPDIGQWRRGIVDNLSLDKNSISPPQYTLPERVFNNRNSSDWDKDLVENSRSSISLKPSGSWDNTEGYLFFDKINLSQENIQSLYGVFESGFLQKDEEVLFRIESQVNGNYLEGVLEKVGEVVSEIAEDGGMVFVKNNHQLKDGDLVVFDEGFTVPMNFVVNKEYRVTRINKNSFSLSESITTPTISGRKQFDNVSTSFPGSIIIPNHGLSNNDEVSFSTDGELPAGIFEDQSYFIFVVGDNEFQLSVVPFSDSPDPQDLVEISSSGIDKHYIFKEVGTGIVLNRFVVSYYLKHFAERSLVHRSPGISLGHVFVAGLDINQFANFFGGNVSNFLKNLRQLNVYFGGTKEFQKTYSGQIQRIGFANRKNSAKLKYLFDKTGIPFVRNQFDGNGVEFPEVFDIVDAGRVYDKYVSDILSHIASYTLLVKLDFRVSRLEVAVNSSWQDYLPLTYFAKKIAKNNEKLEQGLNFLQFSVDYPAPEVYSESCCDTSNSVVKTYISFQYVREGANKLPAQFSQTIKTPNEKVVVPGSEWISTRYEVVDNTVIYLPPNVDFKSLAVVVDVEIKSDGILLRPVKIKSLSIAGRALNETSPNAISSRFGYRAFPYTKYGIYLDHDDFNPFSIYRDSTPYLYLSKYSGVKVLGDFSVQNRGILFPINEERKSLFSLSALQFLMRFEDPQKLNEDLLLFEIEGGGRYYGIKARSIHPQNEKLQLYSVNRAGQQVEDIGFYLNGSLTKNPAIAIRDWNMLGMALANPIGLNRATAQFRVVGPVTFNAFSHYALTATQEAQRTLTQSQNRFFLEKDYFGISPKQIFNIYAGTNKIIAADDIPLVPKEYQYTVFKDNNLRNQVFKPV